MRINHNISSMITQESLVNAQTGLSKSLEKLSTGLRINRASDDAAGLSVSEKLRSQIRGLGQAQTNAQDGQALLQIADGAANEITSVLQRMRELAVQSANSTLTTTDRSYTDQEFQQLMKEVNRISQAAQYNGMTLLDGTTGSFGGTGSANSILQIGANNNTGTDQLTISLGALTLGALGMTLSTTNVTNGTNASNAIATIDTAIRSVSSVRSGIGAYVNRLDHAIANLQNQIYNTQDAESRIRDVDFASETTNFTRAQILSQSATSMLAQANQVPQGVLSLLR